MRRAVFKKALVIGWPVALTAQNHAASIEKRTMITCSYGINGAAPCNTKTITPAIPKTKPRTISHITHREPRMVRTLSRRARFFIAAAVLASPGGCAVRGLSGT